MTEPVVNTQKLGGLTYNANSVSSAKEVEKGKFEITFKSGEKITYPQQPEFKEVPSSEKGQIFKGAMEVVDNNATIKYSTKSGMMVDDSYFEISNVMGAKFSASKENVSHANLIQCTDTVVDLKANDSKLYGDSANIIGGKNNEVLLDKKDRASFDTTSYYFKRVKGEGSAAQKDYR